jgi:hypothetical protein
MAQGAHREGGLGFGDDGGAVAAFELMSPASLHVLACYRTVIPP